MPEPVAYDTRGSSARRRRQRVINTQSMITHWLPLNEAGRAYEHINPAPVSTFSVLLMYK
jgi:hypothetical protein